MNNNYFKVNFDISRITYRGINSAGFIIVLEKK